MNGMMSSTPTATIQEMATDDRSKQRPLLVLDSGGVLMNAGAIRSAVSVVTREVECDHFQLDEWSREQLRVPLWSGKIAPAEFAQRLIDAALEMGSGSLDAGQRFHLAIRANQAVANTLHALPAITHLAAWHERAEIWLLSNHHHAWLGPALESHGAKQHIDRLLISSLTGHLKPCAAAFAPLVAELTRRRLLYVDDSERNIRAAAMHGIPTLQATPDPKWIKTLNAWVG